MNQVTFAVTYEGALAHPVHRRLMSGHAVTQMALLQWGPTGTVTTLSWYDAGPDAVADLLAVVDSATTTELVAGDGGTYAFVHQTAYELGDPVVDVVAESRVAFRPPVVFDASGEARFEAVGRAEHLSALAEELEAVLATRIERVRPFGPGGTTAAVTDRQRTALAAAVAVGYYAVPRTGDLEDVAAELDCAPSTAGELVRKGEAALVREFVDGRDDPRRGATGADR